jgi:hypothetical protein
MDPVLTSEMNITIVPDIAASTPASPLFGELIYILDIRQVRIRKKTFLSFVMYKTF